MKCPECGDQHSRDEARNEREIINAEQVERFGSDPAFGLRCPECRYRYPHITDQYAGAMTSMNQVVKEHVVDVIGATAILLTVALIAGWREIQGALIVILLVLSILNLRFGL